MFSLISDPGISYNCVPTRVSHTIVSRPGYNVKLNPDDDVINYLTGTDITNSFCMECAFKN